MFVLSCLLSQGIGSAGPMSECMERGFGVSLLLKQTIGVGFKYRQPNPPDSSLSLSYCHCLFFWDADLINEGSRKCFFLSEENIIRSEHLRQKYGEQIRRKESEITAE